jgi:Rhodanese-related sulfurtransferase
VADQVHDLTPEDVAKGVAEGRYLLVDVREPNEVAVEAYPDAVVVPLSSFDPQDIPIPRQAGGLCLPLGEKVGDSIAGCSGRRLAHDNHLAGGLLAWKAAGLPTKTGG